MAILPPLTHAEPFDEALQSSDKIFFDGATKPKDEALKAFELATLELTRAEKLSLLPPQKAAIIARRARILGQTGLISSNREKIKLGKEIRSLAEEALKLDSENMLANGILGVFHFELANLSGVERFFAKVIYGDIPEGRMDLAETYLKKALLLDPTVLRFRLVLTKTLLKLDRKSEAKTLAQESLKVSAKTPSDQHDIKQLQDIFKNLE